MLHENCVTRTPSDVTRELLHGHRLMLHENCVTRTPSDVTRELLHGHRLMLHENCVTRTPSDVTRELCYTDTFRCYTGSLMLQGHCQMLHGQSDVTWALSDDFTFHSETRPPKSVTSPTGSAQNHCGGNYGN